MADAPNENGVNGDAKKAIWQDEIRLGNVEGEIRRFREQFPTNDPCKRHGRNIHRLRNQVHAIGLAAVKRDSDEWKEVITEMRASHDFRIRTGTWLVIISVLANALVGAITVAAVNEVSRHRAPAHDVPAETVP